MDVKIIKLGGSVLATTKDKEKCVKRLNLEKNKRYIIVVSAMGRRGFPYATDSLSDLALNIKEDEKDRLLSCGEIISSISFSSFLNDLDFKAKSLSYKEIGINVLKNKDLINRFELDKSKYINYFDDYNILVIPGFLGKNEHDEVLTLGRGNSDLTAILIAKMFNVKNVTLLKDVDGVYPFILHPLKNYKPYERISFNNMELLLSSGASIISKDALLFAKKEDISIDIMPFDNDYPGTKIYDFEEDLKVVGFFVQEKQFDIVSSYPCLIKEEMSEEFLKRHIIIKRDFIDGFHYRFILESSQLLYAKRLIVNKYFKNFIK